MNKPKSIDEQFNEAVNTFKENVCTSIRNGSFKITPSFAKKIEDIKNEMQENTKEPITPIMTIDSWAVLSKADRRKMKNIIKLKI